MNLTLTFWIAAWCLMAVTFIIGTGAILLGTWGLDRNNSNSNEDQD